MAVPKLRFKTDDGSEFPEWEKTRLCTLMSFKNGITASREQFGKGIKCISVLDILNNHHIVYDCIKSSVEIDDELIRNFSVEYGDFVFQRSSENVEDAGRANVYLDKTKKAVFSGFVIRGKKISNYEPLFINELLRTFFVRKQIMHKAQGAQHINIGQEILNSVVVYLPSLPEQKKIASFLLTIDDIINQTQSELTAWQERKKGVMQKIFNREVRFKADDGSEFPEWEEKRLGELGEFIGGGTPSTKVKEYWKGTIPWISSSDVFENDIQQLSVSRFITEEAIEKSATKRIPENSICIVCRVGVGKVVIAPFELCTSQDFVSITALKDDICFLGYAMWNLMQRKISDVRGTSIKGIPVKDLREYMIDVPSLPEQRKIADCLSSLDDVINQIKAELSAWKEFKKGLLQQMFV